MPVSTQACRCVYVWAAVCLRLRHHFLPVTLDGLPSRCAEGLSPSTAGTWIRWVTAVTQCLAGVEEHLGLPHPQRLPTGAVLQVPSRGRSWTRRESWARG